MIPKLASMRRGGSRVSFTGSSSETAAMYADKILKGASPADRQRARPHDPTVAAGAGGSHRRVTRPEDLDARDRRLRAALAAVLVRDRARDLDLFHRWLDWRFGYRSCKHAPHPPPGACRIRTSVGIVAGESREEEGHGHDAPYDEHGLEEAPDEERALYPTEAVKILR